MPFKLKLKKSRQYNVSSKNLFMLTVELLDKTTIECTLSAHSLGQECLNNVCQRLALQQYQFFGLRYLSKKGSFWWVDLKRPLKRQLDKYALESCNLYLGVMFFVSDVNILHDEVTRYHYFLQLKCDILEGKLPCTEDQIITFASYSLQAEFGDHDPERHTTEYLSNFGLLPKPMVQSKESEESILERVILSHCNLQGMSQQLSEVYYIMEAQRLNGYGLECFAARDHSNNNIIFGVSLTGLYIWYLNNQPSISFTWDQIINLVHHKRCLSIEHRNATKVLQIYMEDSHLSKYVWKTCIQQHVFYTKNEGIISNSSPEQLLEPKLANTASTTVNNKPQPPTKPVENRLHNLQESHDSLDGLGVYHTEGHYSENIQPLPNHPIVEKNLNGKVLSSYPSGLLPASGSNSSSCISTIASSLQSLYSQSVQSNLQGGSVLRRASSSDVSIHRSLASIQESAGLNFKPVCSVLPTYRQAPDYNTAIKQKYGLQSCSTGDMSPASPLVLCPPVQLPDFPPVEANHLFRNSGDPPVHTYSSPDLAVPQEVLYQFKPPPPYPYKPRSSSSTPDLSRNNVVISHPSALPTKNWPSSYKPVSVTCTKVVTSNPIQHQTVASSQSLQSHSYENCKPPAVEMMPKVESYHNLPSTAAESSMGPMLMAAMNGLSISRPNFLLPAVEDTRLPTDNRIQALESRLAEGLVFLEFERIPKKKPNADFSTALLPENTARNRFKDVFPYEENRVRLTPTSENTTGYINASHLNVCLGSSQRSYIAAQGPLPNTLYSFWQMVWEHHVTVIVMLTEVQEEGRDKCFPYWPQEDGNKLQIGEFQIVRNFSMSSSTYVTCSLSLCHVTLQLQRSIWHIQYTDWPDHSCPHDLQGFIAFMSEVDAVRRHASYGQEVPPVLVHCSAGVGRSGAVLLCDIMLYCLDHNQVVDVPKVLTHLRIQRMLTVQTLAQYKFVYTVLIQYLRNSRLI